MEESPQSQADHLSPGQRSTIRRAVQEAIDTHGVEWARRNTCAELEAKYGITYATIDFLVNSQLPNALPEELLTSGQRHRIRRDFQAAMSPADSAQIPRTVASMIMTSAEFFGVSEDTIRAVIAPDLDTRTLTASHKTGREANSPKTTVTPMACSPHAVSERRLNRPLSGPGAHQELHAVHAPLDAAVSVPGGINPRGPEGSRAHMSENDSFAYQSPNSWLDAFPWLRGAAEPGSTPWWNAPIAEAHDESRQRYLATVSELAMERLTHWTIGEIFPGLSPGLELRHLDLPKRASNALNRQRCLVAGDLSNLTLDEVMEWRQVGVGVVDAILKGLAEASTSLATPTVTADANSATQSVDSFQPTNTPGIRAVVEDLTRVADWCATIGMSEEALVSGMLPQGTPDDVLEARRRIELVTARDILIAERSENSVARSFDHALNQLDPRAVQILRDRLFADELLTLDELGRQHGVTRERIRQIEGKARGAMLSIISQDGPLAAIAETARTLIGTIRALDDLLNLLPALGDKVECVDQPAWRVLDRLDDAYEIESGWCVVPTLTAAQEMTQTQLQEKADQYGVVRIENLSLVESSDATQRTEQTAAWLAHCGYVIDGDFVLTRTQSVADYGAAVLSLAGTPLSAQELVDRFAFERTAGSLRNAISLDDRFERVDRQRWALREWGMEAYAGIRSLIREQVAGNGGRIGLDQLIEHLTGLYSVSASSVVAYASSPPFEQRDGVVTLAGSGRQARKTPQKTRRLFRRPNGWAYRVRITKDHLRGSGSVAPMAIASILDLQFGQTRHLESPLGAQAVAWTGTQPSFGTIRRFLLDGDISADTEAFLIIGDDGTFAFAPLPGTTGDPLSDALNLCGGPISGDAETARKHLAGAVGLAPTTPVTSLIGAYRERGDDDIADLLTQVRDFLEFGHEAEVPKHETDVDDILDLL